MGKKSRSLLDKLAKCAPNKPDYRISVVMTTRFTTNTYDGVGMSEGNEAYRGWSV
jgi:hypothetical protein